MRIKLFLSFIFCIFALTSINAQTAYQKLADDTFGFIKAGTFAKPSVSKRTTKLALAQVRVHYKFVTTTMTEAKNNSARVSVYLDGAMTEQDLQNLTDEFYRSLQRKLATLGVSFTDWQAIQATDYYKDRMAATEDNKRIDGDVKNGQGWMSFTAFDGPVFMRWAPEKAPELIAYGKQKKIKNMCETLGADFATLDAVVDFTSINLGTDVDYKWIGAGKYLNYTANMNVAPIMSVPQSYVTFLDEKIKFDGFNSKLPVVVREYFSGKPYQDDSKASLMTKFFGGTRFTFTPVVVPAQRDLYLAAARKALDAYADLFVEKLRGIRGAQNASSNDNSNNQAAGVPQSTDNRTMKQINDDAKKNNETTPQTYGEFMDSAETAKKGGNLKLAAEYYGGAMKMSADRPEPYFERATVYANLKDNDAAIKDLTQFIKMKPDAGLGYYNRGTIYFTGKSDYKKAIADFTQAIQLIPDYADVYINRGLCYAGIKKFDLAENDLNRAISLSPNSAAAYRARSIIYKLQGKTALAQADELRAAQLGGE